MRLTTSLAILAMFAGTALAGHPKKCVEAARAHVALPAEVDGIDGFRIVVAEAGTHAQSDVTVIAGKQDRTLRAFAPGELTLLLDAPLRARSIDVALEPVLDAPAPACVSKVELLRAGQVVGTAEIK